MRNIRLTLAYDGSNYVGWQRQPRGDSIQVCVESAIEKLTHERSKLMAAGRTDSGVHALGQVANFQTSCAISCDNIRSGLQHFLPEDIAVLDVAEVPIDFHATYWAKQKRYRYIIYNSPLPDPFVRRYAWPYSGDLDVEGMHEAAQVLVGKHDFRCFETRFPNKATSVRTIKEITVDRYGGWPVWRQPNSLLQKPTSQGEFIWFDVVADGFLYNMVRAIVGTLLVVGRRKWGPSDVKEIVVGQDRSRAGETAPAQGLYLVSVDYGESAE